MGNRQKPTYVWHLAAVTVLLAAVAVRGHAIETHVGTVRLNSEVLCLNHCTDYYLEPDTGKALLYIRAVDLPLFVNRRVQVYGARGYCSGCLVLNVTNIVRLPVTGVELIDDRQPIRTSLSQNYPNPFNPSTDIEFQIENAGPVSLKIYDVLGREQATVLEAPLPPGAYRVHWNAGDLPSGMYYYRFQHGPATMTRKMLLVR